MSKSYGETRLALLFMVFNLCKLTSERMLGDLIAKQYFDFVWQRLVQRIHLMHILSMELECNFLHSNLVLPVAAAIFVISIMHG